MTNLSHRDRGLLGPRAEACGCAPQSPPPPIDAPTVPLLKDETATKVEAAERGHHAREESHKQADAATKIEAAERGHHVTEESHHPQTKAESPAAKTEAAGQSAGDDQSQKEEKERRRKAELAQWIPMRVAVRKDSH